MPENDKELLELMRRREQRESAEFERQRQERAAVEEMREFRKQARMKNEAFEWNQMQVFQSRCDHRKGTTKSPKAKHIDYDVSRHVFANGVTQIKCLKCKFKSFPGDTRELCSYTMDTFMSKGKKIPNPTRLSYADWYGMTLEENTTNRETRAEIVTQGPQPVTA